MSWYSLILLRVIGWDVESFDIRRKIFFVTKKDNGVMSIVRRLEDMGSVIDNGKVLIKGEVGNVRF